MPVLEELFEATVLKTDEMSAEQISELKGYVPPVLKHQIEAALTAEFGRPIMATDWSQYKDPTTSYEQAARLIHQTLAIYSNIGRTRKWSLREKHMERAALNEAWIKEECEKMLKEIKEGNADRWECLESLIGPEWTAKLSAKQMEAVRMAVAVIGKNPALHPKTKAEVVAEICKVVHNTME